MREERCAMIIHRSGNDIAGVDGESLAISGATGGILAAKIKLDEGGNDTGPAVRVRNEELVKVPG
jgi:hypothetical protein